MEAATAFESNSEISTAHVEAAIASRATFRAFLERAAAVARPEDGGPKVLMAIAALPRCTWLAEDLFLEILGDELGSQLDLLVHGEVGERIFPSVTLDVPFDEFVRAVRVAPQLIRPFTVRESDEGRLMLMHRRDSDKPTTRMKAVRDDVHGKPTVVRMTAVRPEAIPESRRKRGDEDS